MTIWIPDFRCKDPGDIGNVKLLFLKASPDSSGYRNFLCLGCHNLSTPYISNRNELFNDHCYKYHAVKSRGTSIGSNLYFEVIISYVVENGAALQFASNKNISTMGIIKRIGLPAKGFYDKHVREAVININKLLHQRFIESSVDNSFIPLNLDEENSNICSLVTEMTKKIHTFICITEDGWSDWKKSYESLICHLTRTYKLVDGDVYQVEADHFNHPLSLEPVKSKKSVDIYQHVSEIVNTKIGSFNQISAFCTDGASNMEGVREMLQKNEKVLSIRCVAHLIQLYFTDSLTLLTQPPSLTDTKSEDLFLTLLSSMDLDEEDINQLCLMDEETRKKCVTVKKVQKQLQAIKHKGVKLTQMDLDSLDYIDSIAPDSNEINEQITINGSETAVDSEEENVQIDDDTNNIPEESESFYTPDFCRKVFEKSKPNQYLDDFLGEWDTTDYSCESEHYKKAIGILKDANYSLDKGRNIFKILRKISTDFNEEKIKNLKLKCKPKRYISIRWNSMKEFIEPYLQCNFRPRNFYLHSKYDPFNRIPVRYWLSYEDLILMRIIYSHLKELFFLTKFASRDDISPFLYRSVSNSGYTIGKKLLDALKELDFINEDTFEQLCKKNMLRFEESTSTAIVEILDLLSVESISKGVNVKYLATLMYQLFIFKTTDNLKVDFDGHFSPKNFDTRRFLKGSGSLSIKTLQLRKDGILKCYPYVDHELFKKNNDSNFTDEITDFGYIVRNRPDDATATQNEINQSQYAVNDIIGNGKSQLLKMCINCIKQYELFVQMQLKRLKVLANDDMPDLVDQDTVGVKSFRHLKQKNTLNLIVPSEYIKSNNEGLMCYLLNFAQSIAIHTTSNERAFSVLKFVKGQYRNNINYDLFEAYLHLHMWHSKESDLSFFEKMHRGLEVRRQRDINYGILIESNPKGKKNNDNTNNNDNVNEQSDGNTNNNNNVNRESDNNTNNNDNISVGNVGKDFTINNTVNSFVFYNNQINIPSLTEEE
ncbi:hypothetical protein HANVADRAFT_52311 [Hanseniaspora valbyensis NRRL Y-1626]|uniref:Uncharacterized protein n=1 Tax=Hanseniaspora valbyensis NRRL Y-1626 TaxID=766949 RepID=A0A1B7TEV7_9ASCO|nr:hypothetical protein HANVADRAFT_52311 [Hanseniaspora valbyensis NRRL Y-1626]